MNFQHLIREFADFIRHYLQFISLGITAIVIMLLGPYINGVVKQITGSMHWVLRYIIYILLCVVGYGFLATVIYVNTRKWFGGMPSVSLVCFTVGIFLALAWITQQQKD